MVFPLPKQVYKGVTGTYSLNDLDGFPLSIFYENTERYKELDRWYSGDALDTTKRGKGDEAEDFPARVNPIRTAAEKHVSALFGEYADGGDAQPVRFRIKPAKESVQERSDYVESILQQLFSENNAGPAMIENGLLGQRYGGCVFRLAYDPEDLSLQTGLRLDVINPPYFVGIPNGSNFWDLREAWVVQQITSEEALRYGVDVPNLYAYYIEHWMKDSYSISINNVPIEYTSGEGDTIAAGENRFGCVPFVYIPHIRNGAFYGESIITDAVKGLLKELNKNIADAGDAAKSESTGWAVMSGVRGMPQVIEIAEGLPTINIGSGSPSFSGGENKPTLTTMKLGAISTPMVDLVFKTQAMLSRELYTPDVAYGEFGGGSQRSSSSLYTMMWHLTAHTKLERTWWTAGLRTLARIALRFLARNDLMGITDDDARMQITIQWSEPLPRDRTELINELSVRAANNLGSLRHLLELTGDVDNAPAMVEEIKAWLEDVAEIEAKSAPTPFSTPAAKQTAPSSSMPKKKKEQ